MRFCFLQKQIVAKRRSKDIFMPMSKSMQRLADYLISYLALIPHSFTELVVFTGASKGPGLVAAKSLIESGKYHVVIPTHDISALQSKLSADQKDSYTPMECNLESFESVKSFCNAVEDWRGSKKIDRLVLGASTYTPELVEPQFTVDGHEKIMQVNYLSHYLMVR